MTNLKMSQRAFINGWIGHFLAILNLSFVICHLSFAAAPDPDAQAIKDFNEQVLRDDRVELVMLPVGDGLTLARVK